jgi:FecR protein
MADGSFVRIGPDSKVQCDGGTFTEAGKSISDRLKLLLGEAWAATSDALGGDHSFDVPTERAGTGVRGSAFTAQVMPSGKLLFHVIEGTGFIDVPHRREFSFPAGEGVLIPAGQQPPSITELGLSGAKSGKRAQLRFRLNQAAKMRLEVRSGRHVVEKLTFSARKGGDHVRPFKRALLHGRYTLLLTATNKRRVSAVQLSFHA